VLEAARSPQLLLQALLMLMLMLLLLLLRST